MRELVAIFFTGVGHVVFELAAKCGLLNLTKLMIAPDTLYNIVASGVWTVYCLYRIFSDKTLIWRWGLDFRHFLPALKTAVPPTLLAILAMLVFSVIHNQRIPPASFLILGFLLYPFWGFAQQFVLQNFIRANLSVLLPNPFARIVAASLFFSLAHFPNAALMILTFIGGFFFSMLYERHPNAYAIGFIHGLLGAAAYHIVLGCDPLAAFATS